MRPLRITILIVIAFVSMTIHGQLFKPLGLGIKTSQEMVGGYYQPQIHIEGNTLFACTSEGLYSKDLSNDESAWQLVGFNGIPLQDYASKGNDILAMRHNINSTFLLLSHDRGKTYEDVTPTYLKGEDGVWSLVFLNLVRHPTDPNTLLFSTALDGGIFLTSDFGHTWKKLLPYTPDYIGFHPLNPEVIYEVGGERLDEMTDLHISYDGGQTWQGKSSCLPMYNNIFRMAFHPSDPNRWIAGGYWCVHRTKDNGQTWETSDFSGNYTPSDYESLIDWRYAIYDNENSDIIYLAGGYHNEYMKLMCSTDGGATWNRPYLEPIKTTPTEFVFDMKQYGDKLLIYSQSDVYMVSKAELLEQTTSIHSINKPDTHSSYFDLQGRRLAGKPSRGIYIEGGEKRIRE